MKKSFTTKSIVFVGTRQIGVNCLSHLIETVAGSDTQIVGVLTTDKSPQWWSNECQPDVWEVAEKHHIPLLNEADIYHLDYEVLFCAIYLKIFPKSFLANAKCFNVNLHPGPVPNYRGCWGYPHAIINNESQYGVSLHFMDEKIDAGDIIEVKKFPIIETDTARSLYLRTLNEGFSLFKKWLPAILNQTLMGINQQHYAATHKISSRCYAYNSLDHYFKNPIQNLSSAEKERLKRALHFPPLFDAPSWL